MTEAQTVTLPSRVWTRIAPGIEVWHNYGYAVAKTADEWLEAVAATHDDPMHRGAVVARLR